MSANDVITAAGAVLSVVCLAIFLHYLLTVLYQPIHRQREKDFDPDTISGWHIRGDR